MFNETQNKLYYLQSFYHLLDIFSAIHGLLIHNNFIYFYITLVLHFKCLINNKTFANSTVRFVFHYKLLLSYTSVEEQGHILNYFQ